MSRLGDDASQRLDIAGSRSAFAGEADRQGLGGDHDGRALEPVPKRQVDVAERFDFPRRGHADAHSPVEGAQRQQRGVPVFHGRAAVPDDEPPALAADVESLLDHRPTGGEQPDVVVRYTVGVQHVLDLEPLVVSILSSSPAATTTAPTIAITTAAAATRSSRSGRPRPRASGCSPVGRSPAR